MLCESNFLGYVHVSLNAQPIRSTKPTTSALPMKNARLVSDAFQPLLPMCKEASLGLGESALREYVDTVLELRDPRRIPSSLEGVAVKLASVSAVAPEQLIEKLAAHHYIWK